MYEKLLMKTALLAGNIIWKMVPRYIEQSDTLKGLLDKVLVMIALMNIIHVTLTGIFVRD